MCCYTVTSQHTFGYSFIVPNHSYVNRYHAHVTKPNLQLSASTLLSLCPFTVSLYSTLIPAFRRTCTSFIITIC
ncbi:hypothetical protein M513_04820 [Trichuris suis]|uniref:Uncharacterized protein n=1 Tax=Trichuris suis TaxID=68888 RepID=A0A085MAN2_9BILA|nr:hypothetical protein M513_04820 [Trichuris suis]